MNPPSAAIGIDLGGTKIEALVLDATGTERWRRRVATPAGDYDTTLHTIAQLVTDAERESGLPGCTVGLGTPGSLTGEGLLKNANSTCLNGRPVQRDVEHLLGRSVRMANDADCLALSEATDGAGAGAPVVFAVILGTGVGAGIAVDGRVLQGPNGLAGEWGHNPLPWAGDDDPPLPCWCGQRGCIETWLSGPAISRDHLAHDHAARGTAALSAEQIAQRAAAGDVTCEATLARWESRLARSLAHVINLLDPHVVVVAGGLSKIGRLYENVPRRWSAHVFSGGASDPVRTRLVPAAHGDASGVRGAAWLGRAG